MVKLGTMGILAQSIDFSFLDDGLAADVEASISDALAGGAVFLGGATPLDIFRSAVDAAIRDVREHPRGNLLLRFVIDGPYEGEGDLPPELAGKRLTDAETARAIAFIYSSMVNAFQGRLAELLGARPGLALLRELQHRGIVSSDARLFVGDIVVAPQHERRRTDRAADLHVLRVERDVATVGAIGEVKSYAVGDSRMRAQLDRHLARCRRGLLIGGREFGGAAIRFAPTPPIMISIRPSDWRLPRDFHFEDGEVAPSST